MSIFRLDACSKLGLHTTIGFISIPRSISNINLSLNLFHFQNLTLTSSYNSCWSIDKGFWANFDIGIDSEALPSTECSFYNNKSSSAFMISLKDYS